MNGGDSERLTYSMKEAAALVGISERHAYDHLPSIKIGHRRLVRKTDLERWLADQPLVG
ncbi:MAG: helix-turn-helix domain-containing protein [Actinomycetota bacterium]